MTLRTRILLVILAMQLLLVGVLAAGSLDRLRRDIATETRMGAETARNLVLATIGTMQGAVPADRIMALLPERLTEPRHARIGILDALDGTLRQPAGPPDPAKRSPRWFAALVAPDPQETRLPVVIGGRPRGYVLITGDPAQEIARAWRDMRDLMALALVTGALQAGLIAWAVGQALRPVGTISARLSDLTRGDLEARIGPLPQPDLAPLARHADALAEALEQARRDRTRLQHQIVARGDAERKAIARDLHDEMGPCLFGLRVEADALRAAATDPAMVQSAEQIAVIAEQIARVNRALLNDLRPMAVGQLPLAAVLSDYAEDLARRFPDMTIGLEIAAGLPEPDEATALTLFRILQEGTTNALRHAQARQVDIRLWTDPAHWRMILSDDGTGIAEGRREGAGLTGMRERITLLGGDLNIATGPDGTVLQARLPRTGLTGAGIDGAGVAEPGLDGAGMHRNRTTT
ncbi:histidine kinase [Paracoccus nototheniae]|uniref:histidine kinase n=1 Tax=Paracoccus nototheniae TaxID=2489002 RepID=A0ABW4DU20_9RHOB|nr:histidine kinase [Paracoccus nototheniae]